MAKKKETKEQMRTRVMETLWLTYFNDTLFERGVITELERNKMRVLIKQRDMARAS